MTDRPATQYSEDGHYWWDGNAWRPVAATPAQPWGPLPPSGGAGPLRERSQTTVLLGILVAAVALLVGGTVGGAAGNSVNAPVGPSAVPPIPAEFPSADQRYLQDVTVSQLAEEWLQQQNGFTCEQDPSITPTTGKERLDCWATGDLDLYVNVTIDYDDETHVTSVSAGCDLQPGDPVCASLFSDLGGMVFSGQPDLQRQARDWAGQNVFSDGATTIGGVNLVVALEPHNITCTPAV
jgi:hypothetical protein